MSSAKPVIHGPDHRPGGADPITGIGGLQYHEGTYGEFNVGDWLNVQTTTYDPLDGYGILLQSTGDGAMKIDEAGGNGFEINSAAGLVVTAVSASLTTDDGALGITANGGGNMQITVNDDADMDIVTNGTGTLSIAADRAAGGDVHIDADFIRQQANRIDLVATEPIFLTASGGTTTATIVFRVTSGNYVSWLDLSSATELMRITSNGTSPPAIYMFNLPTSAGATGLLYNSGGTLKVS